MKNEAHYLASDKDVVQGIVEEKIGELKAVKKGFKKLFTEVLGYPARHNELPSGDKFDFRFLSDYMRAMGRDWDDRHAYEKLYAQNLVSHEQILEIAREVIEKAKAEEEGKEIRKAA